MKNITSLTTALLILAVYCLTAASAYGQATIVIQNSDPGFSDPSDATPVGGNNGVTVGDQRRIAFEFAANIWGATLRSTRPIEVFATWETFSTCAANSGALASAGATSRARDFAGAIPGTWYGAALANALRGSDADVSTAEIRMRFNVNLGTPDCLSSLNWYYGLDTTQVSGRVNFVAVVLHELSHGLGFQTFTNRETGVQPDGFPSIYDRFLLDTTTGKTWPQMTDAERVASAINTGGLVWNGPNVKSNVPFVLSGGTPSLRINGPPAIAGSYSVGTAVFGPPLTSAGVTGNVIQALNSNACASLTNSVSGAIALVDRGDCPFVDKVKNAQNAGAVAVIVVNNESGILNMGGTDPAIVIPSVLITTADGNAIKAQLAGGVNATVLLDMSRFAGADSTGRPFMYTPSTLAGGSSVSHWDSSAFRNQLMEPNINSDLTHNVTAPHDLTFALFRDIGWLGASTITPLMQLSTANYSVSEDVGSITVTVSANGPIANGAVSYATSDTAGLSNCNLFQGKASSRCDYVQSIGTLRFNGESEKTISIPIVDDSYAEGDEEFTITLSSPAGASLGTKTVATIRIIDNDGGGGGANPLSDAAFFVRQHYLDFLNREPDSAGLNFWRNEIGSCGSDVQCIEVKQINVSAAFYLSIEFQQTGYLVYRMYKAAYGNMENAPVPLTLTLTQFLADTQAIGSGVIVNQGDWQQHLNNNKNAFADEFVRRHEFGQANATSMTAAAFVEKLFQNAGVTPSDADRQAAIAEFPGGESGSSGDLAARGRALRRVAENSILEQQEFNRAFVLMQYFGYLRRNPNEFPDGNFGGYNFWLNKLIQFNGNFLDAEMVKAFILAGEFRERFGP